MPPIRLGAVGYLNAQPLAHGLDRCADRFSLRFDVPSQCATLLHEGAIDVGLIPSIEYLRGVEYRVVPDVTLASDGPVASVALFTGTPIERVRSIALDSGSRTSATLLRALCAVHFGIAPAFVTRPPVLDAMLGEADAALLIGDAALFLDHAARGLEKIDLGQAWADFTGLPFVWAFWAGRSGAVGRDEVRSLQAARDAGVAASDELADAYAGGNLERARIGRRYLRENMRYGLGEREVGGLNRYFELSLDLGLVDRRQPVRFFQGLERVAEPGDAGIWS